MADSSSLRLIFAGTPAFAASHLQALIDSPHDILAVYTQPDRPAGRGKKLSPSPVKTLALEHNLPVLQPTTLKDENAQAELKAFAADVMVVVAYGLLLPQAVLDAPKFGCINVHGSLLPRWRGAAPVQRAVEAGDAETGVTIMQMDAGLDTGPMLLKATCPINSDDTSASIFSTLEKLGAPALLATLQQIADGSVKPEVQNETAATYANKIDKAEAQLNWQLPAKELHRKIRAFNPMPVAYTNLSQQRIKVHAADVVELENTAAPGTIVSCKNQQLIIACGEGALSIKQLQLPGKKAMAIADVLRGNASLFNVGEQFNNE